MGDAARLGRAGDGLRDTSGRFEDVLGRRGRRQQQVGALGALEGDLDLVFGLDRDSWRTSGVRRERLFDERFVCVVRRGHPTVRARLRLKQYCGLGHVLIAPVGASRRGAVDDVLNGLGRQRRIVAALPHFLVAPHLVAETDYVLTLAERVALRLAPELGLKVVEAPVEIPGFTIAMYWHARHERDPGHAFLRDAVRATLLGERHPSA